MSAALRGMVSGRDPHNATTRPAIIKAYGLKISVLSERKSYAGNLGAIFR
jgi:hypothetical protein